jgi:2'-5' RNA ligase
MEKPIAGLPGYPVNEYLLVLQPDEDVWNKIMEVKKQFAHSYDCPSAPLLKPHIALARFTQYEMVEARIMARLATITAGLRPFMVELNGFGSFPAHTVYLRVGPRQALVDVVRAVRDIQRLMKLDDDNKPHFITEPHIAIARKLQHWQYEKSWQEYSQRHFTARFMAGSLLLQKRRQGEKQYRTVQRYPFQNLLPVITTQGELFG